MDNLYSSSAIKKIMNKHGAGFTKSLGQNFLTDYGVIEDIVLGAEIDENDHVIEIGPGIGVLTAAAAQRAKKVTAIEIDQKLIPILKDTLKDFHNIEILNEDVLKCNLEEICMGNGEFEKEHIKIIGNLPYYITTPIIMKILEEKTPVKSITIMMQKEVADRLKASPGTKQYGAITASVNYYCSVSHVIDVPKEVFVPMPKVDSTVIRLDILKKCPVQLKEEKIFFETIKAGFGQRRKTLLNALTGLRGKSKEEILLVLQEAQIDSMRRAETLSIEEFATLANLLV